MHNQIYNGWLVLDLVQYMDEQYSFLKTGGEKSFNPKNSREKESASNLEKCLLLLSLVVLIQKLIKKNLVNLSLSLDPPVYVQPRKAFPS